MHCCKGAVPLRLELSIICPKTLSRDDVLCEMGKTFRPAELRSDESAVPQSDCGALFDGQPFHFLDDRQEPVHVSVFYLKTTPALLKHVAHDVAVAGTHEEVRLSASEDRIDLARVRKTASCIAHDDEMQIRHSKRLSEQLPRLIRQLENIGEPVAADALVDIFFPHAVADKDENNRRVIFQSDDGV